MSHCTIFNPIFFSESHPNSSNNSNPHMTNDHDEPIIRPINQSQARLNHKSNSLRSSNPLSSLGRSQLNESHDVYSGFANIEKSLDDRLNEVEPYENASSADTLAKTRKMNSYMNNYSKIYWIIN